MHELGITRNVVAIVLDAAKGQRVTRIALAVGRLAGVMPDAIAFCFDVVTRGTPLEGTQLDIVDVPGAARCRVCGAEYALETQLTPCACGSRDVVAIRGEELMVKTMEVEEAA
jgi:hydrogenase nickel incorporation protein HypA/HybF